MKRLHYIVIIIIALMAYYALAELKSATAAGTRAAMRAEVAAPRPVRVHAHGRGLPEINLTDGHALAPAVLATSASKDATLRPRVLAAADFDADGVPDLVCAYATDEGGLFVVRRGNADTIYPHSAEAQARKAAGAASDEPFLPEAWSAASPIAPDFVAAGDFDGDGWADIVAAARGRQELVLLRGDGRGAFAKVDTVQLPGVLTAFGTGELGRHDEHADIALGVTTDVGAQLLIYADAHGALRGAPQRLALQQEVTALAVGQFDDDAPYDLAAATGDELVIVRGTNRIAGGRDTEGERIAAARVARRVVGFEIAALAAGDFAGDARQELALLSTDGAVHLLERASAKGRKARVERAKTARAHAATFAGELRETVFVPDGAGVAAGGRVFAPLKVSTRPKSDLLVGGASGRQLHIVTSDIDLSGAQAQTLAASFEVAGAVVAALPMRLNKDALSDLVALTEGEVEPCVLTTAPVTVRTVTTNADDGAGSLRQAIIDANATPGLDEIQFDITQRTGGDPDQIMPHSSFAAVTDPLTVDGYNSAGQRIMLTGTNPQGEPIDTALDVQAGATAVSGLVMHGYNISGLFLRNAGGNVVEDCYFGVERTGAVVVGGARGLYISNVGDNRVGGTAAAARNLFAGHREDAVVITGAQATGNTVAGNYFGTDAGGTERLGNGGRAISIEGGANNTIGGASAGARNVVAASGAHGIEVAGETAAGNLIAGNYVGTDATGNVALGNAGSGIALLDVPDAIIAANLVSGNGGVSGTGGAGFAPQGAGTMAGVFAGCLRRNALTGTKDDAPTPSAMGARIWIHSGLVGTNAAGTAALPNAGDGILIEDVAGVLVGGLADGDGNVVSGNLGCGIHSIGAGAQANDVLGNMIGTDATGTVALGNAQDGVRFDEDLANPPADYSFIVSNVIAGNGANGVHAVGTAAGATTSVLAPQGGGVGAIWISHGVRRNATGATSGVPVGNRIGTNLAGDAAVPNGLSGILIENAPNIRIGEDLPGHNLIAGNGRDGIEIVGALATNTQIVKTYIGTNLAGDVAIPNGRNGVTLAGASNARLGAADSASAANVIAYNRGAGVSVTGTPAPDEAGNELAGNSIHDNAGLGIDLGGDGVTANDPLDADTGPNRRQNFPVINAVVRNTDTTVINGTLDSAPNQTFRLHLFANTACDPVGYGEGETFLGSTQVTTDAQGHAAFALNLPAALAPTQVVTATATDANGNTSEFSACRTSVAPTPVSAGQLIISEFRFRGNAPANTDGDWDEFVELYNNTDAAIVVGPADGSAGFALVANGVPRFIVPAGTIIPARGHFLGANTDGYSLADYGGPGAAAPDATWDNTRDIPDQAGIALFKTASPTGRTFANRLDAVGFVCGEGSITLYCEGTPLAPAGGIVLQPGGKAATEQFSFVRKLASGLPQDTNDNAADFELVSPRAYTFSDLDGNAHTSILGAPGPENLSSPIQRNIAIKATLLDPLAGATFAPNRVRQLAPVANGQFGTLSIRRKFRNTTGQPVTRLRFRVVDSTTLNTPNPGGAQADVRAIDSDNVSVTTTDGQTVQVFGTTVEQLYAPAPEQPPTQPLGGGLNTTLVVALPGGALANGAAINVQFVLGVQQQGRFRFFVNVEALP